MWQGVEESAFDEAGRFVADGTAAGGLLVCKEFVLKRDPVKSWELGRPSYYIRPKYPMKFVGFSAVEDQDNYRAYRPFEDSNGLFRKFAGLHNGDRSGDVALEWAHTHAPLTCHLGIYLNRHGYLYEGYTDPRDYVDDFFEEVDRAATVLALYEAVLARDREKAWLMVEEGPSPFAKVLYEQLWNWEEEDEKHHDGILGFALHAVAFEVTRMVRTYASRSFWMPPGRALPSRVKWGWNFDNLLGAMYLQMYWLLEAGENNVTHCKNCGATIKLTASKPTSTDPSKTRKVRSDRQFCDNKGRCQQSYNYRTKGKYKRKSKRDARRSASQDQ